MQLRYPLINSQSRMRAIHEYIPVEQTIDVILCDLCDAFAAWIAHTQTAVTNAEFRIGHVQILTALAIILILRCTIEYRAEMAQIAFFRFDNVEQQISRW